MIATDNTIIVVSYINKQRRDSFPLPVTSSSGSLYVASGSGHNSQSQNNSHNLVADRFTRPNQPIMTEWSLHPEIVTRFFKICRAPTVDMFTTAQTSVYVSDSGASSTGDRCSVPGLKGMVNVHVSTVPLGQ